MKRLPSRFLHSKFEAPTKNRLKRQECKPHGQSTSAETQDHQHAANHWKCFKTIRTGKQKLQLSFSTSQASKSRSTTQSWGHWPGKPLVLPTHLPPGQELIQMSQQNRQQHVAEVGCSSSPLTADPSGNLWLQGSSQQITELKPTPCLQQPRTWTRKRDFLPTQRFWLTACPSCRVFNHQEGSRSSATSDRRRPYLRTKHLWPSIQWISSPCGVGGNEEADRCQKWEANWSSLLSPCPTVKQRPCLETT